MSIDLMVIGAHPDDAELFAGGTIAKLAARGRAVLIADLTRGERGTRGSPAERDAEGREAARILGVPRLCLECGDTLIENTEQNRLIVIRALREHRPRVVITHGAIDRHPDHRKACELVRDAAFYAGVGGIDTGQPRHRPAALLTFVGVAERAASIPPATFATDVTSVFEQKLASVRAFRSQFYNESYDGPPTYIASKQFWLAIEAQARLAGLAIGVEFAEAFRSEAPLPIDDIVALFQ